MGWGKVFLKYLSVEKDASSSLWVKQLSQRRPQGALLGVRPAPSQPPSGQMEREQPTGAFLFVLQTWDKIPYPF